MTQNCRQLSNLKMLLSDPTCLFLFLGSYDCETKIELRPTMESSGGERNRRKKREMALSASLLWTLVITASLAKNAEGMAQVLRYDGEVNIGESESYREMTHELFAPSKP